MFAATTLLAHIIREFIPGEERVTTEALGYILSQSLGRLSWDGVG